MDQARHRLDQAGVGIGLHAARELDNRIGLEQAVGVEDEKIVVGAAPPLAEVADIAGLPRDVPVAATIVKRDAVAEAGAHLHERGLLGEGDLGPGRVAQDEPVEGLIFAERANARCHRLQTRKDPLGILVVGRHQYGNAAFERNARAGFATAGRDDDGAGGGVDEGQRNPADIQREEHDNQRFDRRQSSERQRAGHLEDRAGGDRSGAAEHHKAWPQAGSGARGIEKQPTPFGGKAVEPLWRHWYARLGRHSCRRLTLCPERGTASRTVVDQAVHR